MFKLIIFDFDGVFTNGKVFFDNSNNILKYYNIKDGKALSLLRDQNIKIGLISNFNSNFQLIVNNEPFKNLIQHLKFDKVYIGSDVKINVLNSWLDELEIFYNDVAYIGDDLNDIEIMNLVGFSACPNDAINECKDVVNYVCEKKGGEGCVREFVDLILSPKNNLVQEIRKEANYQLNNFDLNQINNLVKIITESKNNIYLMGVGKSGNIAKHFSDLLKSISLNTFYLETTNLLHGDIGCINSNLVIMFSKSGNTRELIELIPFLKSRMCYIVGICCDKNSQFEKLCDLIIKTPFTKEINGIINNIPTNSFMSHLLFCNILVGLLKDYLSLDQYKNNHPAGSIGNKLKKIKDCLIYEYPKILLKDSIKLHDILLTMTKYKIGCCFFVNEHNDLIGILTDGDVRRLLLNNEDLKIITINNINTNYYYEDDENKFIHECKKIMYLPLIKNKKLIGILYNFSS